MIELHPEAPKELPQNFQWRFPELFFDPTFTVYRGSVAHGMYVPGSDPDSIDDVDLMSVVIPGRSYYTGFSQYGSSGTREIKEPPWDIVVYELRKFLRLLGDGNPNVLFTLWLDKAFILKDSFVYRELRSRRNLFVAKSVYEPLVGYARGQLKRMTHVNTAAAFNGRKRQELFGRFGFDCKNAAHTIRLLRMGVEFFETGSMNVYRQDALELLRIKRGEWTIQQVKTEAECLFDAVKAAHDKADMPARVHPIPLNQLCCELIEGYLFDVGPFSSGDARNRSNPT